MATILGWRELYRNALLELRGELLRERITEAEAAIQQRLVELRMDDSASSAEAQELTDALRGLSVLTDTECRSPQPVYSGLAEKEVAS